MLPTFRSDEVEGLLRLAAAWAAGRPDVRALALVGSWARGEARPDSDVDLVLLTDRPARFVGADGWAAELGGRVVRTAPWGAVTERRVALPSGLEVDVGVAEPGWASADPVDPGTRAVVSDGMRALHDPDGLLATLAAAVAPGGAG